MIKKVFICLSLAMAVMLFTACGEKETEARNMEQIYKEEGVPVRIETVEPQQFRKTLNYNAVLSGIEESSAYASIDDRVEKILVQVGDYVKKDRVLLTFPTDNPAARYQQAKVACENAKKAFERVENLYESGGVSQQNYDNAKAQYDVSKANWDAVKQAVKVRAPISGYVTKINVVESDNVDRQQELFTISRTNKMKSQVWISEKDIRRVKVGQPAAATWHKRTITGKVVRVDMAMNQMHQAFGAVLEFENPDNTLMGGITAEIQIETYSNPGAIVINMKNLIRENDNQFVFVKQNDIARKIPVETGKRHELLVEIENGLNAGDQLIIEGQLLLDDSSRVKIIE